MWISSETKSVFLNSFLSLNHTKCFAYITSKNFFQNSTERCSTRCFLLMLLPSFSNFSRHFSFDTTSDVNVSLWNDIAFGLDFIESGRVKTGLHMVFNGRIWMFFFQIKDISIPSETFCAFMGDRVPELQIQIAFRIVWSSKTLEKNRLFCLEVAEPIQHLNRKLIHCSRTLFNPFWEKSTRPFAFCSSFLGYFGSFVEPFAIKSDCFCVSCIL